MQEWLEVACEECWMRPTEAAAWAVQTGLCTGSADAEHKACPFERLNHKNQLYKLYKASKTNMQEQGSPIDWQVCRFL